MIRPSKTRDSYRGFFLVIAADPAPDAVAALRARTPEQDRGNQSSRRSRGTGRRWMASAVSTGHPATLAITPA